MTHPSELQDFAPNILDRLLACLFSSAWSSGDITSEVD